MKWKHARVPRTPVQMFRLRYTARWGGRPLASFYNYAWHTDPKPLTFLLARYKFVAKMFSGLARVLEVGCADAFATRIVRQEVEA